VQHLLLETSPEEVPQIVVIDNSPHSPMGQTTKTYLQSLRGNRNTIYVPLESPQGTSVSRNAIFQHATGDYVLVVDCHVLLAPGGIPRLLRYLEANDPCDDLIQGVLCSDDLLHRWTHFQDVWRAEMWGIWGSDARGNDANNPPFEIFAQGLGLFCARRESWLGFHPLARGFGGEECYIHEKYRRAGRKCLCLPGLKWVHRFGRPGGVPYPLTQWNKVRNYVLEHLELGLPLDRIHRHFVLGEGEDPGDGSPAQGALQRMPEEDWQYLLADPENHLHPPHRSSVCGGCGDSHPQRIGSLEDWYRFQAEHHPDIRGHLPRLRELAAGKNLVVELGTARGGSTAAFLAAKPKRCISVDQVGPAWVPSLKDILEDITFEFIQADSRSVDLPENIDVLFIDTKHTADQLWAELTAHAKKVAGYIVLHDTKTFGETGEDGGPGLLPALRRFLKQYPEWVVYKHYEDWHGLTVLSNLDEHKKKLPSTARQVFNFAKAALEHVKQGARFVSEEELERRLDICALCEHRRENRCSVCGCYLIDSPTGQGGKAEWAEQACPLGKWLPVPASE
jgi:hypothetical protein